MAEPEQPPLTPEQMLAQIATQYNPGQINMQQIMGQVPQNFLREQEEYLEKYPDLPGFQDVVEQVQLETQTAMQSALREANERALPILQGLEARDRKSVV